MKMIALIFAALWLSTAAALAGNVTSHKTGATATVAGRYAGKFQAYVDDLEAHGASVRFMGGIRRGRCAIPRHKHPCGMALDVCQLSRGRVDHRCHLPRPSTIIAIAEAHGLTEGAEWLHSDYGHAEIKTGENYSARQHVHRRRHVARRKRVILASYYWTRGDFGH